MAFLRRLDPGEQHFRICLAQTGLSFFARHLPAPGGTSGGRPVVLYVHGATFPSALSVAYRFDGRSWRDHLAAAGASVWAFDFLGYGESDRYPAMATGAADAAPLCRAAEAQEQIAAVARFAAERDEVERVSLIAHSWGSMPAGLFASLHPELVDRLVLFAPITPRDGADPLLPAPARRLVSLEDQWRRFIEDVPPGETGVLLPRHFASWGEAYLDSDPESRSRNPPAVMVPGGPAADIAAARCGILPYDPALIQAPTLVIRGAWDRVTSAADAAWLLDALRAVRMKRLVTIPRATHLAHLEEQRGDLHLHARDFLVADDPTR